MEGVKLRVFSLAKYISQEILFEEIFLTKGLAQEAILKRYNTKKRKLKIKKLVTKLFYSVIFGILPVIPLMTFRQIIEEIHSEIYSMSLIVFGGSILFVFFFILQFLNIFFMGMIEVSLILSGSIFNLLETLPIPHKKYAKLKYLTIFRSFDIPIIVIFLAFPITIGIVTQNLIMFVICLGISFIQLIFSFNVLIILGEKINRTLDINQLSSRKTLGIRLFNTFGYLIIFFGSFYIIQWAIGSIDTFFRLFVAQESPPLINLILSIIPFPFAPSYLISVTTLKTQINPHYWISIFCGIGLFLDLTWWLYIKALKALKRSTSYEYIGFRKYKEFNKIKKELNVKIKVRKPVYAHLMKDLLITSRNLKLFLSIITPIIISFISIYTFNITILGDLNPLEMGFFYNWGVSLGFQPIIGGILIYSLINIEGPRDSLILALPITPKDQAKAKLIYLIIIQTIASICPYLIYIFDPRFISLLLTLLLSLPYIWLFLILIFEMNIYFFGRGKYRFYVEEINPKNKIMKWILIYLVIYLIFSLLLSAYVVIYLFSEKIFFLYNTIMTTVISYSMIYLIFSYLFSAKLKVKRFNNK